MWSLIQTVLGRVAAGGGAEEGESDPDGFLVLLDTEVYWEVA
jgi:hypothetical protein